MPASAAVFCVGHAVQDFVFTLPAMPTRAEKYRANAFASVGGGPAATAAVTVAKLGGRAHLAARIGQDAVAKVMVAELQGYGVDCTHVNRFAGFQSSISAVMLDAAGERMIVNYLDPKLPMTAAWLPDQPPEGVSVMLADTRWPEGAERMLALAKRSGLKAVLDADVPVPKDGRLLGAATHVAFSAPGLADYSGMTDLRAAIADVSRRIDAWSCVTMGGDGVAFAHRGQTGMVPAFAAKAVDTLGAGDVWHGAFALALAEGKPEIDAVRFANGAAALKVERHGSRAGIPTRAELDAFLAQHGSKA
ncbi:MAG: PfkB family carbohydrate kinase [Rhodospirillaceae bacterium]|nr:PfkB family carbohydrate kinase [Rhodospirillaceae bacterium]